MNFRLTELKERIISNFQKDKRLKFLIIIGIIGIVLIGLSEFIGGEDKKEAVGIAPLSLETDEYKKQLESELTEILSNIDGVGNVKVMLTIEGTTEYIFAEEVQSDNESSSDRTSESFQNNYVIIDKGSSGEPLIRKVIKPKVNGVVVVCEGGDNVIIAEKVYSAVSTVLAISSNRVCVVKG